MNRVVVTGATSLIGIALIEECIKRNVTVYAIIRENSSNRKELPLSHLVTVIEEDLSSIEGIEGKIFLPCDTFFHLGWANTTIEGRNSPWAQNGNVGYTLKAVETAKKIGCKTFVGAGSQAEYGPVDYAISPDTPINPQTSYGVAKYSAYKQSNLLCKTLGIRHIWVRIFSAYGPHDSKNTMINYAISTLLKGQEGEYTKCEQIWDYLYSADAGKGLYLLGEKGKEDQIYCMGSGEAKPLYQYLNVIRDEIAPGLTIGIGKKEYGTGQIMHLCADIQKLRQDTGFEPETDFKTGISNTIEWHRGRVEK